MDKIARTVGITPEEMRRRNLLALGGRTATGQLITDTVDMQHLLTRALEESGYHSKRARFAKENPTSPIKRGVGFATFFHGAGFHALRRAPPQLPRQDRTHRRRPPADSSSLNSSSAKAPTPSSARSPPKRSACPTKKSSSPNPTPHASPNSGPTVASRTAMIVGKLVETAAQQLCANLVASGLPHDYTPAQFKTAALAYLAQHHTLVAEARYKSPGDIFWDDEAYRGEAYPAYAWAVYVAEVAVDTTTYTATCTDFYACRK